MLDRAPAVGADDDRAVGRNPLAALSKVATWVMSQSGDQRAAKWGPYGAKTSPTMVEPSAETAVSRASWAVSG
jgi:hypothetical protein